MASRLNDVRSAQHGNRITAVKRVEFTASITIGSKFCSYDRSRS